MLFDKLTEYDMENIQNYIDVFGPTYGSSLYSQNSTAPLQSVLNLWDTAKSEYLYKLFGENFILEKEIEYTTSIEKMSMVIADSCSGGTGKMHKFWKAFYAYVNDKYSYYSDEAYALRDLVHSRHLAENSYKGYYGEAKPMVFEFENGSKVKIQPGCKPLRILGKIAKAIKLENEFEEFRLEHSRILNQKQLKGTLCLSIHPMDYMSMSDNCSNWSSCMSWGENGSYRGGTVEMMNSPMVVVAYLKSDKEMECGNGYRWNDKLWRSLIVVHPDGILSVKGYPYQNKTLSTTAIDWLADLAKDNLGWRMWPAQEVVEDTTFFEKNSQSWYYFITETERMYNDFGSTNHYMAIAKHYDISTDKQNPKKLFFHYSGRINCLNCGYVDPEFYDESYVFCRDCCTNGDDDSEPCAECGAYWDRDDMYWVEDNYVCPDCFSAVAAMCVIDGENRYYEGLSQIYLASKRDCPSVDGDYSCFVSKDYVQTDYKNLRTYASGWFNIELPHFDEDKNVYYLNREDITESGLKHAFGFWNGSENYFEET